MKFKEFQKIPRLKRDCVISEKLDGSNASVCIFSLESIKKEFAIIEQMYEWIEQFCLYIHPENPHVEEKDKLYLFAGSRNRWLQIGKQSDNHGFASWVKENSEELFNLGEGIHYGEWVGQGINRNYGLKEKRFYLFNTGRWADFNNPPMQIEGDKRIYAPKCCYVVPVLYIGAFTTDIVDKTIATLKEHGSYAVPFMNPEGVVIYLTASRQLYKQTIENDEKPKGQKDG